MNQGLTQLQHGQIYPSTTNPRKDFTGAKIVEYLNELAQSIRQHGILQPPLVRPMYCVGAKSHADIERQRKETINAYDLICGECRWRASQLAEQPAIEVKVVEMTDHDAREVQLIENFQRRDLTPMEEAKAIAEMLELENDDGSKRYSPESLAEKLGHEKQWVYKRKKLLVLPADAQDALESGELSPTVARLIAEVPTEEGRKAFARAVLRPDMQTEVLSYSAALALRTEQFQQSLAAAPFPLDDAMLLPDAGSCLTCPKYSANCELAEEGMGKRNRNFCLDPVCYRAKLAVLQERQRTAVEAEGKVMLTAEEAAKVYPYFSGDGVMDPKSPYVQIETNPASGLLKAEVTKVETWAALVAAAEEKTGAKVPRVMIHDQAGVLREHVERALAIALIEKSGEPIFRKGDGIGAGTAPGGKSDAFTVDRTAEIERAKAGWAVTSASLTAVWARLSEGAFLENSIMNEFILVAIGNAGDRGLQLLAKWRGLAVDDGEFGASDAIQKWSKTLNADQRDALLGMLLLAPLLIAEGMENEEFRSVAKALQVDLDAVAKKATADYKAKAAGARLSGPELEAKVAELYRAKRSTSEIAAHLGLTAAKAGNLVAKIQAEEKKAKIANDPAILKQWVKAHEKGMPVFEIARSFKVDVADVRGALGLDKAPAAPPTKGKAAPAKAVLNADEKEVTARAMLAAKKSTVDIAKALGISLPAAHTLVKKLKAKPKPPGKSAEKGGKKK